MSNFVQFKYNRNQPIIETVQYGTDQNKNPSTLIDIASYILYDSNNVEIGNLQVKNIVSTIISSQLLMNHYMIKLLPLIKLFS